MKTAWITYNRRFAIIREIESNSHIQKVTILLRMFLVDSYIPKGYVLVEAG